VKRSGFYAWQKRPPSQTSTRRERLKIAIRAAHRESNETYGSPRIHRALRAQGEVVSEKTVAKVMRLEDIRGKQKRRYKVTTDSRDTKRIADNVLDRHFTVEEPNRAWVTDVTAIWTYAGWGYLAAILDLFSRRVVGWAISDHNDTTLALTALRRAVQTRTPQPGLIHHSDRGSPYGSDDYRRYLDLHGFIPSMSAKGDCWDNAVAESFFATIKTEWLDHRTCPDHRQLTSTVAYYIDEFYNPKRLHSTIGYASPINHELLYFRNQQAA
jgi:putative transposase